MIDAESIVIRKRALRAEVKGVVEKICPFARAQKAQRAAAFALRAPALAHARLVLAYRAMPDEIDADPLIRSLAASTRDDRVRFVFPFVTPTQAPALRILTLLEIDASDPLAADCWATDRFGIRAPRRDAGAVRVIQPRDLDAIIVPGRAFDARGARLGRGKGFYDRLFAALRPDARAATIGLSFESQFVPEVPEEPHDRRVAWIATDRRLRRARPQPDDAGNSMNELRLADPERA